MPFETNTTKMELETSTTKKKQVSFFESVKCYIVEPITTANKSCCWYSDEEYSDFRNEIDMIQSSICDDKIPQEMFCIRGMEHAIDKKLHSMKRTRRIKSWDAVFDCQDQQWYAEDRCQQTRCRSVDAIASAYQQTTEESTNEALQRALQDQYEAQIVHTKDLMTTFSNNSSHEKNTKQSSKKSVSFLEWNNHCPIRHSQHRPNIVAPRTA
jgi:hypothetical protein